VDEAQFDRFADEYEALQAASVRISGESPEYFWRYKVVDLARICAESGVRPRAVLDFGAGVGNSVPYLREQFPSAGITCLDVSRKSLSVGEQRFSGAADFAWFDGGRIPFDDATYDVAFVACVLHHIEASEHVTFQINCDLHPVDPARCSPDASCSIRPVWRLLERRINDLLAGITLADLMHQEAQIYQIVGVTAET